MAWIKWEHGLPDKPEVIRMAVKLGIPRDTVVCRLMKFWEWCDCNISDAAISESGSAFVELSPNAGDNMALVDALVGTPGFADSLAAVDWIRFRDSRIELPNFGRHNGETAKTRARNAKNQKKKRSADDASKDRRQPGDQSQMSPNAGDKTVTRGEERREEGRKTLAGASPGKETTASPVVEKPKPPPKEKKQRPPDPLFDAIAEVCGLDPSVKANGSLIGSVAASLRNATPPYSPDEVRQFAAEFHRHCPYARQNGETRPTPKEVEKNTCKVRGNHQPAFTTVIYDTI